MMLPVINAVLSNAKMKLCMSKAFLGMCCLFQNFLSNLEQAKFVISDYRTVAREATVAVEINQREKEKLVGTDQSL